MVHGDVIFMGKHHPCAFSSVPRRGDFLHLSFNGEHADVRVSEVVWDCLLNDEETGCIRGVTIWVEYR